MIEPYWVSPDKRAVIYHGDALEVLPQLEAGSMDMIFTDPPYGHNNNNGDLISRWEAALGRKAVPESEWRPIANDGVEANDLFRAILPEFKRLLVAGGCCCCCGGGGGPDPQFARWSLWLDDVLDFKQMVVWDKGPMGMGWHYRRSYETVLVAQKGGAACRWYDTSGRVENILRHIRKMIPTASQHPTVKPVALPAHFIMLHTQAGDLVLDAFCGSGGTGLAALTRGRRFIGVEIEERWAELSVKRIKAALAQPPLLRVESTQARQMSMREE